MRELSSVLVVMLVALSSSAFGGEMTATKQYYALQDAIARQEAVAHKYGVDAMNFTGAVANAKTEQAKALENVEALKFSAGLLRKNFEERGLKFIDDEWQ